MRIYILEDGDFSFEGDLPEQKTVIDFTILSGLKSKYALNETFSVTGIIIRETYSDGSTQSVNVTSSMVVGTLPSTSTPGQKTLTLKYGDVQMSFTFEVEEEEGSGEEEENALADSFDSFYQTLVLNSDTGTSFLNSLLFAIMDGFDGENEEFQAILKFYDDFSTCLTGQWGPVVLVLEGIMAISAHADGNLRLLFPDPANNYGKTAYCIYEESNQKYKVGYWKQKVLYTYWFEQEISFDEVTDSLRAEKKCGVNENQVLLGTLEYKRIASGNYAANIYLPDDEEDPDGTYTSYMFRFTANEGVVSQNLWANAPASVYKSTGDLSDYGKNGDKTLTFANGEITLVDNLKSSAEEFYMEFVDKDGDYEGSFEHSHLELMKNKAEEAAGYFPDYNFSIIHFLP